MRRSIFEREIAQNNKLRFLNLYYSVYKYRIILKLLGGGLGSSHPLKKA